jgi:hypothetical protein
MAELSEKEKYEKKAELLKKALTEAHKMDAADAEKIAAATTKKERDGSLVGEAGAQELAAAEPTTEN